MRKLTNFPDLSHPLVLDRTSANRILYTQSNDNKHIYAHVLRQSADDWKFGERKAFVFTHLQGNDKTKVSMLGYKSELVEYQENFDAKVYVDSTSIGLVVSVVNGQRFYTNRHCPNAVVLKIETSEKIPTLL